MSSELVCSFLLKAGVASGSVSQMSVRVSAAPQSFDCAVWPQANETHEEPGLDRRTLIIVLLHAGRVHEATALMGTGNYEHLAEMYELTRAAFGPDPMRWSLATRASVLPQTAWAHIFRCTRDTFDELAGIVCPWLNLPKRCSHGFFSGLSQASTLAELQAGCSSRGRPYSQSHRDRLIQVYIVLRNAISGKTATLTTLYSPASTSRHTEHGCWAICNALEPFNRWPTPAERDALYAAMPDQLRDYMASRGYNPAKVCVFAIVDGGNTTLAEGEAPPARCDYYSHKNSEEGYANM